MDIILCRLPRSQGDQPTLKSPVSATHQLVASFRWTKSKSQQAPRAWGWLNAEGSSAAKLICKYSPGERAVSQPSPFRGAAPPWPASLPQFLMEMKPQDTRRELSDAVIFGSEWNSGFSCLNPIYFKTSHYVLDHYNLWKNQTAWNFQAWSPEAKEQAPHTSPPAVLCMAAPSSPTSQSIPGPAVQASCDGSQGKEKRWGKKRSCSVQWRKLQNIAKLCTLISSC